MVEATEQTETTSAPDRGGVDSMEACQMCGMQVRRSEMDIHLGHAHNRSRESKKPAKKQGRQRDR